MAHGDLEPLSRAAKARGEGTTPSPKDLDACKSARWRGADSDPVDMQCWNGKRPDRPQCNFVGSQNIPVWAETGLGAIRGWRFHPALARCWRDEGMMGMECGSPGKFYYEGVMGCMSTAYKALSTMPGRQQDAEDVRLAIRSAAAWDAITALPTARLSDRVVYSDKVVEAVNPLGNKAQAVTVAVSGMRWSEKAQDRTALTSEDAHSDFLRSVFAGNMPLTDDEIELLRHTVAGIPGAARTVAGWMWGTIHTPTKLWKWGLRRTTLGAESVFLGAWPNSMKPMRVVTQITYDGQWVGMRPSPEDSPNQWADGFTVAIGDDGVIRASCAAGSAELPQLGGDIVWQVDVDGPDVRFTAGPAVGSTAG